MNETNITTTRHKPYSKKACASWTADIEGRAGSPFIGTGQTEAMAIVALIARLDSHAFVYYFKRGNIIKVNGTLWTDNSPNDR